MAKVELKNKIPPSVSQVTEALEKGGFEAYLVGGCVRDLLLGRPMKDWDVATAAKPEEIIALFPKTFYENKFGTVTVVDEAETTPLLREIQVTPYRLDGKYSDYRHPDQVSFGHSLAEDLARRDFTINALAYHIGRDELIDNYKGQIDLSDKTIRAVGEPADRFEEDPLRIMRGVRLAVELGFTLNTETLTAMQNKANLLKEVSPERIRDEFSRIILSPNILVGIVMLEKIGALKQIIPELEEGIGIKQNGDHIYEVWEHTLRVAQHAADRNWTLHVRLAALFHDIGKPRTRRWSEEKKDWTFYGHDVVGARMAETILKRLKFSRETVEVVKKLVRNHMFFTDIDKITLSAVRRIVREVGPENVWDLMKVRQCDRIGMGRPKENPYRLRKYESMIEEALRSPTSVGMLKIKGEDVLRETGLSPGPKIGYILHALLEEVLENPDFNEVSFLSNKAKELAKLEDKQLQELGEKGKDKREEIEGGELKKIRDKYRVK